MLERYGVEYSGQSDDLSKKRESTLSIIAVRHLPLGG